MITPWPSRSKRAERRAFNKRAWADLTRLRNAEFALRGEPPPAPSSGWQTLYSGKPAQSDQPEAKDESEPGKAG
jgi:hypothetical protein